MDPHARRDRGFSLTELMLTVAVLATILGMGVPVMMDLTAGIKATQAARAVERELQYGRLRAVNSNRIVRVRMNCPAAGQLRTVELLNTSADTASNRCDPGAYPFPAPDDNLLTRPNYDGPVRDMPALATVPTYIIEFHPNGTARQVVSGSSTDIVTPLSIVVTRTGINKTITVNGAGKVLFQ
jgi:prepilin-type N-terminal cleavage/methylation domain-containing protein